MNLLTLFDKVLSAKYTHLEEDASFAYKKEGDTLYILFEWSNSKIDWKNNFDFPAKPYRNMKEGLWFAHRGFVRVWKIIEPHLQSLIHDTTVKKIIVAGYSHGAAIALLCHEYCVFNRPDIKDSIFGCGYGCPRVVFGFLCKKVKSRFNHFIPIRNKKDIVTHVPPVFFGFRHAGNLVTIGDGTWNCIDAHRPNNYKKSLQETNYIYEG